MNDEPEVYVLERVREALAKDPRVSELELDLAMADDRVFVSGTVATEERRRAIPEVLREVLPGREVVNQTSVLSVDGAPGGERIE